MCSVASEIMVGKTPLSDTYTQAPEVGTPYNLYLGTLEARPLTATTSKLLYTLFYDNMMLPDEAARAKNRAGKVATFQKGLENMTLLAEGGTLPPAPATQDRIVLPWRRARRQDGRV